MSASNRSLARVLILILIVFGAWIKFSVSEAALPNTKTLETAAASTVIVNKIENDPDPAALAAWDQVYSVLISPRCINCHTATNYPQQADDRHLRSRRLGKSRRSDESENGDHARDDCKRPSHALPPQ